MWGYPPMGGSAHRTVAALSKSITGLSRVYRPLRVEAFSKRSVSLNCGTPLNTINRLTQSLTLIGLWHHTRFALHFTFRFRVFTFTALFVIGPNAFCDFCLVGVFKYPYKLRLGGDRSDLCSTCERRITTLSATQRTNLEEAISSGVALGHHLLRLEAVRCFATGIRSQRGCW